MELGNKKYSVVGLGEILWDILPDDKKLGGAPANFAYHAHCLGAQGYIVSSVGNDSLGDEILESVDKLDLNRDFVFIDNAHPTGTVSVELDNTGTPNYIIHKDAAWDFITSGNELLNFAPKVDAVCFGSLCQRSQTSRDTVRKFLSSTNDSCLRIFDINIRQDYYSKDIIEAMLEFANVFKLNDEELPLVADLLSMTGSEEQILQELMKRFSLQLIVLTKGGQGSVLFGNDKRSQLEVSDIKIADTVGAGDSFTAAVAMGLLQNKPLEQIHAHANRLASFVCTQNGATPTVPGDCRYE